MAPTAPRAEVNGAATQAVSEAARIAADASRRTVDTARAAVQATRSYMDDSSDVARQLFSTWTVGVESMLKASFEIQNAANAASLTLLDSAAASKHRALEQWSDATRQAQDAVSSAWQMNVRTAQRIQDNRE